MSTATEFFTGKVFTWLTLLVGVGVVGVGLYAVYVRPTDPPAGTAAIEVTRTPGIRFEGTVRTEREVWRPISIEGETPRTFNIDEGPTLFMLVGVRKAPAQSAERTGTLKVAIRVGGRTVEEGQTQAGDQYVSVVWNVPDALKP